MVQIFLGWFFVLIGLIPVPWKAYILFLGTLTMCCMGVAMINVGATYEDDVSTYLIVGGFFVMILYLLLLMVISTYVLFGYNITENGEQFWPGLAAYLEMGAFMLFTPLCLPLLLVPLVYLGILIWGTSIASGKKSS